MNRMSIFALCLMFTFCVVQASAASAAELSFVPQSEKFPVTFEGTGGEVRLETVGGAAVSCSEYHKKKLIQNPHLSIDHLIFLKCKSNILGGGPCTTNASGEEIDLLGEGHLGLRYPGDEPGLLILVPTGFSFSCTILGTKSSVSLSGEIVGNVEGELNKQISSFGTSFKQASGKQEFTEFELSEGGGRMTGMHLTMTSPLGTEEAGFAAKVTLSGIGGETIEIKKT